MVTSKSRKQRQPRDKRPHRTRMSTAPSYSHGGEDAGDDSKRSDSSVHGFNVIKVASPDLVSPFSAVMPSCLSIIGETVCACVTSFPTENSNAQLELPAPCFVCDYDIVVLETTEDARFLQYPEPRVVSNANVRNKKRTRAVKTDGGVDDGDCGSALLNATNTECYGNIQLDQATMEHDPICE